MTTSFADHAAEWCFAVAGPAPWTVSIDGAVPSEDRKREYWAVAVPQLAAKTLGHRLPDPCVVVVRVTAPMNWTEPPGGPVGRAKSSLDALHDDRSTGPYYWALGATPPLLDDTPAHLAGLAVEVRPGERRTQYTIGKSLGPRGTQVLSVAVEREAPNDVVGTPSDKQRIAAARVRYAAEVREAFASKSLPDRPKALVIRHWPQRDEDNTWATWVAAACGVRRGPRGHWAANAPLADWAPTSIASVADPSLDTPVVYEIWA